MYQKKIISVVVPAYNEEKLINKTLSTIPDFIDHIIVINDFSKDSTFHRILWDDDRDQLVKDDKIKRVVLCTGKVYYDLLQERRDRGIDDVTLIRLEQLYPFPHKALVEELKPFKNADVVWCQEEPENQGAWYQIKHRLQVPLAERHELLYATRPGAATTAVGYHKLHVKQQEAVVEAGLTGGERLVDKGKAQTRKSRSKKK